MSPPAPSRDRFGNPMTLKLKGNVEPYFKDLGEAGDAEAKDDDAA